MPLTPWMPLAPLADLVLLLVRLVTGVVMVYYGWPKILDPARHIREFEATGFKPVALWATVILVVEFFGGLAVLLGLYTWLAAALFAGEMATGAAWKLVKARKPFPDYSYDLQLLALCLVLLAFGPGAFSLDRLLNSRP
jgi:putative oxidoreductase